MNNPESISAHFLTDEQQAEWVSGMKLWEKENPLDKPARNAPAFGVFGAIAGGLLIWAGIKINSIDSALAPALGIPFGYLMYYLTNHRYQKWDLKRRTHSEMLIMSFRDEKNT